MRNEIDHSCNVCNDKFDKGLKAMVSSSVAAYLQMKEWFEEHAKGRAVALIKRQGNRVSFNLVILNVFGQIMRKSVTAHLEIIT